LIFVALNSDILVLILTKNFGPKSKKTVSFCGTSSPRPPTGALPLDLAGGLPSPRPPPKSPNPYVHEPPVKSSSYGLVLVGQMLKKY